MHGLRPPPIRLSPAVLAKFKPVNCHAQLKAQFFLIGDMRSVDKIDIADRRRLQNIPTQGRCLVTVGRLDCLLLRRDFIAGHLGLFPRGVPMKTPGDETMPVGIDEIAGDILADRGRGRPGQIEVHGARAPEGDLRPANHGADFQTVSRQEPLGGEHAVRIEVVVPLRLAAMPAPPLQPFHESIAAAKQRFVLRTQRSFALAAGCSADGSAPWPN